MKPAYPFAIAGGAAFALLGALFASAPIACAPARSPEAQTEGDAGELTCDEKARAESMCRVALRQRCDSQANDCEATCQTLGGLPGNAERKHPSDQGEMEATACRGNCLHGHDACVRTVAQRCPVPCE